jgi:hypothetical protein
MKTMLALIILVSFSAGADEYQAPKVKLSLHPHSEPTVKGTSKWEEDHYKVQETQEKERALASEEEEEEDDSTMLGRNPSSKVKGQLQPDVMFWKWEK